MLNRCYIKLSLVNILENVFVFIEILFKMLLFKGGVRNRLSLLRLMVLFRDGGEKVSICDPGAQNKSYVSI